jgi:uncharacterized membrane protein YidH (DUF202 family)
MAWVRTALSMVGFGFTIYKFLQALVKEGVLLTPRVQGPKYIGLFLIGLGTLAAFMGSFNTGSWARTSARNTGSRPEDSPSSCPT